MNEAAQSSSNTAKKTIYLIRHGETEFNRLGIVQGSGIDSDLNETGKDQARRFYLQYGHIPFDRVYTSALRRTHQSVAPFLEKNLPHTPLAELNEISWGDYEGVQTNAFWKQDYLRLVDAWKSGDLSYRVPGGENPLELQARQKIALQHILSRPQEEQILICMHGRAMKSFLCLMLNMPLTQMDSFQHHNLGLYMLDYDSRQFRLTKTNCVEHL